MRKTLFAFALLLNIGVQAQITYKPGYFIRNNGQRVDCFIRDNDKITSPENFQYRLSEDGEISLATIDSVRAFEILNTAHKYQRYKVRIERSEQDINNLMEPEDIVFNDEVLFLRVLVEGNASLYVYYTNKGIGKFFYRLNEGEIKPLIYYIYRGVGNSIGENNSFRQELWNNLKCSALSERDFERLECTESQLVRLFSKYNRCVNPRNNKVVIRRSKAENQLAFFVGVNDAALELQQNRTQRAPSAGGGTYISRERIRSKLSPVIGFSYTHVLAFNNATWAFFVEPAIQVYKNKLADIEIPSGEATVLKTDYSHLVLPVGLKRLFPINNNAKLYLKGAAAWNVVLRPSHVFATSSTYRTTNGLYQEGFYAIPQFIGEAGFLFQNKYSLEVQYHFKKVMLDSEKWKTSFDNSINILFGYRFK